MISKKLGFEVAPYYKAETDISFEDTKIFQRDDSETPREILSAGKKAVAHSIGTNKDTIIKNIEEGQRIIEQKMKPKDEE